MDGLAEFKPGRPPQANASDLMSDHEKLTFFQIVKSTLMSFFGVQKESVRKRDFEKGRPLHFIVTGIVLTVAFILVLLAVVKFILYQAGV